MKKIQIALIPVLFLLLPVFLSAQTESYDAEYLKLVKEYTLNDDGSTEFHFYKKIKLNTHYAFHRLFGETFIVFNPDYQELVINEAYTVMADGKKVDAPENAYNKVLPRFARDIPAYNHLREMVVTHTGTEVGCVITLDYTLKTKAGFLPFFFGSENVEENMPVKELNIIVNVPQNTDLNFRMLNNRTAPEVTENAGQKAYNWKFRDVKALPHTGYQDVNRKQVLFFSTVNDMTRAFYAFVNQDAFKIQAGPDISRRVETAVKDKETDLDIILDLQAIVIDEVKLAGIPMIYSGYKARTPDVVWQSANATSLEKAILLADMLKLANINAHPVVAVSNGWYSSEMGNPAVFDSYMVQVHPKESGRIYLSVTKKQTQNLIYDVNDKTIIQLDAAIETMRTFKEKPVSNKLEMEAKLKMGDKETGGQGDRVGVSGDIGIEMEGFVNPYYRLRKDDSYAKKLLEVNIPGSKIEKVEQVKLSEIKSQYKLGFALVTIEQDYSDYLFIELPMFKVGFDSWHLDQFAGTGDTPVRLDYPLVEEYNYAVSLSSDYVLFTPPPGISIKNELGELEISITQSGSIVKIKRSWELNRNVISSDHMDEFKAMILAWEKTDYRKIVLKKK